MKNCKKKKLLKYSLFSLLLCITLLFSINLKSVKAVETIESPSDLIDLSNTTWEFISFDNASLRNGNWYPKATITQNGTDYSVYCIYFTNTGANYERSKTDSTKYDINIGDVIVFDSYDTSSLYYDYINYMYSVGELLDYPISPYSNLISLENSIVSFPRAFALSEYGIFNVNCKISYKNDVIFNTLKVGYSSTSASRLSFTFVNADTSVTYTNGSFNFIITFYDGEDINNPKLIKWVQTYASNIEGGIYKKEEIKVEKNIFDIFTNIITWISSVMLVVVPIMWTGTELTTLGILAVCGLAVSVILLLIALISRFLKFRG